MWLYAAHPHKSVPYHYLYVNTDAMIGLLHPQVDVIYNEETQQRVIDRVFQPTPNDLRLREMESISDVWNPPSDGHIHVFVSLPSKSPSEWFFFLVLGPSSNALSLFSYVRCDYGLA